MTLLDIPAPRTAGVEGVPDAVLAYAGAARSEGWFLARRAGITATDVPAIVGASEYRTALHVWLDKRGDNPLGDTGGVAAEAGTRLEPVIRQWWSDDNGTTVRPCPVLAHRDHPWMIATPDGIVDTCPDGDGPCILEIKNRNAYVGDVWREDVPDDVLAQVGWQMAVTGCGHTHVAALIGGNTPRWHRIDRDPDLEAYLISESWRVWTAFLDGVPPQVDPSDALSRLLDALYPHRAGDATLPAEDAAKLWARYREAAAQEREGKKAKDALRNEVIALLDAADAITVDGVPAPLVTYRASTSVTPTVPADELRRLQREHPYTYRRLVREGYLTEKTGGRTLRWSEKVGKSLG